MSKPRFLPVAVVCTCLCQSTHGSAVFSYLHVQISPAATCAYSRSLAAAMTSWDLVHFCAPCNPLFVDYSNEFAYDLEPDSCGSHAGYVEAGTGWSSPCPTAYYARAEASTNSTELLAETTTFMPDFSMYQSPDPDCYGFAAAVASPKLAFDSESEWSASVEFSSLVPYLSDAPFYQRGMVVAQVLVDDALQSSTLVLIAPSGTTEQGCVFDYEDDLLPQWTEQTSIQGPAGEHTLSIRLLWAEEKGLDVDEDGRFSIADADSLADIVGTGAATDPDNLTQWDFDGDDEITDADVAIIRAFIDAGASAGIFADADGSGSIDCGDFAAASPYPLGAYIADPDYIAALDENIDGLIDQSDLDAFLAARSDGNGGYYCCPGDANFDGSVDVLDFGIMSSYWGQTVALGTLGDLNYDGIVDVFDQSILTSNFGCSAN